MTTWMVTKDSVYTDSQTTVGSMPAVCSKMAMVLPVRSPFKSQGLCIVTGSGELQEMAAFARYLENEDATFPIFSESPDIAILTSDGRIYFWAHESPESFIEFRGNALFGGSGNEYMQALLRGSVKEDDIFESFQALSRFDAFTGGPTQKLTFEGNPGNFGWWVAPLPVQLPETDYPRVIRSPERRVSRSLEEISGILHIVEEVEREPVVARVKAKA